MVILSRIIATIYININIILYYIILVMYIHININFILIVTLYNELLYIKYISVAIIK